MWFCSNGLGPAPSSGATTEPTGSQLDAAHTPSITSVQILKGFAAVAMSPNQKTATNPITPRAPAPSPSPLPTRRATR